MPTRRNCVSAGNHQRRRNECAARDWVADARADAMPPDTPVPNEHYRNPRLGLKPDGPINSDTEAISWPFKRAAYSHIHESTSGEIEARLAGAHDGVPYFTQVTPIDDNFFSLSVDVDTPAGHSRVLRRTCDQQIATSWDTESFFAQVMVTM